MSLWAEYARERNGTESIEHEFGFITFRIVNEECYIEDAFVRPSMRQKNYGSALLEQVEERAKKQGCKFVTSCIRPSEAVATISMKAQLARGFRIHSAQTDKIYMIKEIDQ